MVADAFYSATKVEADKKRHTAIPGTARTFCRARSLPFILRADYGTQWLGGFLMTLSWGKRGRSNGPCLESPRRHA